MDDFPIVGTVITFILVGLVAWFVYAVATYKPAPSPQNEIGTAQEVQNNLTKNTPVPKITTSLERENVAKRAEIFNAIDKISYIYLVNYGKVMAFYTVKGKVSSLRSYMFPESKIVKYNGEPCEHSSQSCYIVDAADIDGTYGENVEGIFFFTTEGAYVEWKGDYMMSDQPLKLTTQPELIREVK